MRATVDEVVFGRDIGGSAAATPVAAGAAFDGAAGLDTDRIRLDQLMSTKRHLRPHDDTIESALKSGWGGKAAARPRAPATADPSLLTAARRFGRRASHAASPRMSDVVTPRDGDDVQHPRRTALRPLDHQRHRRQRHRAAVRLRGARRAAARERAAPPPARP